MAICDGNFENIAIWSKNDAVDTWTLSASSSAASHPVTEIKNSAPGLTWKSNVSATTHWVEGASIAAFRQEGMTDLSGMVLVNYLFPDELNTTIRLQCWNNEVGGTEVYNKLFITRNYLVITNKTQETIRSILPYKNRVIYLDRNITGQIARWRITIVSPLPQIVGLGRVFFGEPFQPKENFVTMGAGMGPIDKTRVSESYGGNRFSDNRPRKRFLDISFPNAMTEAAMADIPDWMYMTNVIGSRTPIFVDPWPKLVDFVAGEDIQATFNLLWQMYGRLTSPIDIRWDGANVAQIKGRMSVEEEL